MQRVVLNVDRVCVCVSLCVCVCVCVSLSVCVCVCVRESKALVREKRSLYSWRGCSGGSRWLIRCQYQCQCPADGQVEVQSSPDTDAPLQQPEEHQDYSLLLYMIMDLWHMSVCFIALFYKKMHLFYNAKCFFYSKMLLSYMQMHYLFNVKCNYSIMQNVF